MEIPFKAYASPDVLAEGDIIALFAGNETPSHATTITRPMTSDEYTPAGYVTLWTTDGRYDVPADTNRLWVADWAPMATFIPDTQTEQWFVNASPPRPGPAVWRRQRRFRPMGVR